MRASFRGAALLPGLLIASFGVGPSRLAAQEPDFCAPVPLAVPTAEPPVVELLVGPPPAPLLTKTQPEDPPTPAITLRVRVPATAPASKELEYRICAENRSPALAHHVLVRVPLPSGARYVRASPEPAERQPELLWRLGSVAGGGKSEITLVVVPTGAEDVKLCARVQFEHGECVCTKIPRPGLRLEKTGPEKALLYDSLNFRLTVTNIGTADLVNVRLTDKLPAGLEPSGGKDRLNWIIGTLPPGQSKSVDYQVIAKAMGRLCNTAIATAEGGLRDEKQSCVAVTEAKLGMTMHGPARRYLNVNATYEITLNNAGTGPLENVSIDNPLPPQTEFVAASEGGQAAGNQVRWVFGTLEPGASRTVELTLRALSPGHICNRATAQAERGLTRQAEVCTDFAGVAALELTVQDSEDPVEVGKTTMYNITVHNPGSTPATNVRIAATVPSQMAVLRATPADYRVQDRMIVYEPRTIPAGGDVRFQIEVRGERAGDVRFKVDLTADQLPAGPVQQEEGTTIFTSLPPSRREPGSVPATAPVKTNSAR
jgi:uncharacterized repeat protein (TIGR01451 family)